MISTAPVSNNYLELQVSPVWELNADSFFDFCQLNSHLRIERNALGKLILFPLADSLTGNRNAKLIQQLANWTDKDGTGIGFDSSAGFILPNGATRSPDASWIKLTRWNSLSDAQKTKFAPIAPDFIVELRSEAMPIGLSPSDSLQVLKDKLQEYIDNGVSSGWLIDRPSRQVYIYTPGKNLQCLDNPSTVGNDSLLPGFNLDLTKIW